MAKVKFFTIKRKNSKYEWHEGMFIAESMEQAREIAKKNGFKVDDSTVFEDVTQTENDKDKVRIGEIIE